VQHTLWNPVGWAPVWIGSSGVVERRDAGNVRYARTVFGRNAMRLGAKLVRNVLEG
jgi:hypothetical protein